MSISYSRLPTHHTPNHHDLSCSLSFPFCFTHYPLINHKLVTITYPLIHPRSTIPTIPIILVTLTISFPLSSPLHHTHSPLTHHIPSHYEESSPLPSASPYSRPLDRRKHVPSRAPSRDPSRPGGTSPRTRPLSAHRGRAGVRLGRTADNTDNIQFAIHCSGYSLGVAVALIEF